MKIRSMIVFENSVVLVGSLMTLSKPTLLATFNKHFPTLDLMSELKSPMIIMLDLFSHKSSKIAWNLSKN